jgi:Ni,Fe-hydrogenase III component G
MRINERFEDLKAENQQLKDRIIRLEVKTEVLEEVLKELKAAMATKAADLPDEAGTEKKPARTSRAKKTT